MSTSVNEEETQENEVSQNDNDIYKAEAIKHKTELAKRMDKMTPHERKILVMIQQYKAIEQTLEAMKNMKKTEPETWKNVLNRLNNLTGFNVGDGEVDFNEFLKVLIPLIGALAGCLMALKGAEKAEIESAEPENNVLTDGSDDKLNPDKIFEKNKQKSVVLTMCDDKKKGFSL